MQLAFQVVVNGLTAGSIIVLIALGLTLIFGLMRMVNVAHGEIYMVAAFGIYFFSSGLHFNYYFSALITIVLVGLMGVVLEPVFFRPFRKDITKSVVATVGLAWFLQSLCLRIFGIEDKYITSVFTGTVRFYGVTLSVERAVIIGASTVALIALALFLQKVKVGWAMRAASEDTVGAALQGIPINRIFVLCMVIGCALAALAGVLIAPLFWINPFMGISAIGKSFMAIILGGMGSIRGVVLAGFLLGFLESISSFFFSAEVATILSFALVLIVLVVRPAGLLGST